MAVAYIVKSVIAFVGCYDDAAVLSNNHGRNTIDAAAIVTRQEGIAAYIEDHRTTIGRVANRGQVEVLCRLAFHLIGDACHCCIKDCTESGCAAHRSANPIVVRASSEVADVEGSSRAGDSCSGNLCLCRRTVAC